jgi:alanine dehydrogenase
MEGCIGIRQENKDLTERRAALTPKQVKKLVEIERIRVIVEPADWRIFSDEQFREAGAEISSDLSECNIIFGVKEIPLKDLMPGMVYCFFSHTIKGQSYNMPMLKRMLDLRNTLLDYELVTNEKGKRLIFFGNYAGYAGMVDSLWALGLRLQSEGIPNPFLKISQTNRYENLAQIKNVLEDVAAHIKKEGLPEEITPLICGFSGYGQVSHGAQQMYDILPVEQLQPSQLEYFFRNKSWSRNKVYKVEFREEDLVQPKDTGSSFDLQEYYDHPEKYKSIFERYLPYLTILINGIYWEPRYPRLVTLDYLKSRFKTEPQPCLRIIGDITCDVEGSIECTVKATNSRNPIYIYNPLNNSVRDGYEGQGVVILAVDKLPSELPLEASRTFGKDLFQFVPALARADFRQSPERIVMPEEFRRAIIAHQGQLTPKFKYLGELIRKG